MEIKAEHHHSSNRFEHFCVGWTISGGVTEEMDEVEEDKKGRTIHLSFNIRKCTLTQNLN